MKRLLRYRPRREHLLRLLGSLLLALVVWIYVTISQNPETQFSFESVPVEVQGLASGFLLTDEQGIPSPTLSRVTIVIWAPQSEHIGLNDLTVYVDMSVVQEAGTYDLPVQVRTQKAVRKIIITPDKLTVRVEPLEQELFPIRVVLQGQPGLPYIVGTPQVAPAQAMVQGPLSRVKLVRQVEARVDLAGRGISLENTPVDAVAVDAAGSMVKGVAVVPARATVSVPVALQGGHVVLSVTPVTTGRPAAGYYVREIAVEPDTVTIFSGDPAVLAAVRYLQTRPVDLTGRSSDFTATVELDLPPNVALINSPAQVTVTIYLGTIVPEVRLFIPVRLEHVGAGFETSWDPQWLTVLARGSWQALQDLRLDDLWASVDLEGLEAGEYDLPVSLPAAPGVEFTLLQTDTVHVVLALPATPTPTPTPTPEVTPSPFPPTPTVTPSLPPPTPTPTPTPPGPSETPGPTPTTTRMPSPTP